MKSNQRISLRDKILPPLGRKVFTVIFGLLGLGAILCVVDVVGFRKACNPSDGEKETPCVVSDIVTQFYASFFTAALSIWGVELVLREETIKEIEDIFNLSEAVKGIEAFYHDKNHYHQLMADKITNLKAGETIKMLLLSEEVEILGLIGEQKIKEKLRSKCHFQILLVDPNSTLLNCIDKVSSKDRKSSIKGQISNFCQAFNQRLTYSSTPDKMITGSLEIRFHKDVFSSFCYLSGEEMKIVWMYFFDSEGSLQYPGFRFSETNQKLIQAAEAHFDKLWSISKEGKLPEERAKKYFLQIAGAIKLIQQHNFLHRDIKPDNILITPDDRAVLIDFGAAKEFIAGQTRSMSVTLTPGYAPLEQYSYRSKRYPGTDFYAFCASLYEVLTGELPAEAPDRANNKISDPLIPPRQLCPQLSPLIEQVILTGMKMDVGERFQSADELIESLNRKFTAKIIAKQANAPIPEFEIKGTAVIGIFDPDMGPVDIDLEQFQGGETVSHNHAEIYQEGGVWKIKDLGSSNGIFIKPAGQTRFNARITTPVQLNSGDEIAIAKVIFLFQGS